MAGIFYEARIEVETSPVPEILTLVLDRRTESCTEEFVQSKEGIPMMLLESKLGTMGKLSLAQEKINIHMGVSCHFHTLTHRNSCV